MEFTNQGSSEDRGSAEALDNKPENLDIEPIEITASSRGETCVLSASKSSVDCEGSNNVYIHTGSVSVECNMTSSSPVSICEQMDSVLIKSAKDTPVDTVESSSSTVNNERKPTAKVQTTKKKSVRPKGKIASSVSIDVTEKKKIVSDSGIVRATETRTAEACPVIASTSSTTDSFEVADVSQGDKTKKRKTRRGKKIKTTEKNQRDGMELSNNEVIDLASLLQTPLGALSLSNGVPDPELVRLMNRIAEVQAGMNSGNAGISGLSQTTSNQLQSGSSKSIDKKKKSKKKAPDAQAGSKSKEKLTFERYVPENEAISGLQKNVLISGAIRINQRNYKDAYINSPDKSQDIMIEGMRNRNRALEGDEVIVRLNPESDWKSQLGTSNKQKTGTVVFIKEKIHPRVGVGFLKLMADKNKDWVQFSPRDSRIPRMRIPAAECPENFFKEAENYKKTLFLARIEEWQDVRFARGTILERIGDIGDLKAETLALLLENDIETSPYDTRLFQYFPRLPYQIPEEEYNSRSDLRKECIFTIDPETAKDLDDAVSCKELDNGNLLIGVHISDVSYFLKEGTPLDLAVSRRATSTYLVEQVYHMLPREMTLLCSLLPGDDKLAFSVFWEMTPAAEIVNHSFTRSIINSCTQLAYEHAQVMLDNPDKEWNENELPRICGNYTAKDLSQVVNHLNRLAVIMRSKRFEGGALRIDQTKLMFALDPRTGLPTAYKVYVNKESHRLIEEFMLLANMTVAARLNKDFPDLAFLRCHPTPHEFVMDELKRSMEQIGVHLDVNSAGGLQASMWRYAGDDFLSNARMMVLNNLCAKPMARAKYFCAKFLEEENYKHYALNVPLYTHFTSPIRRYADVMVHRLLCASLGYSSVPNWDPDNVQKIASTCNKQKYQAKRAGEQSIELFLAIYVGLYGPFVEEAVVMDVKDVSFDIIICSMGFVQRVYTNNNFQTQARVTCITDDNKKIIRQEIEWHPSKTHPYTTRQGVHIFSIVTVELSRSPVTNKVESRLLRPHE